MADDDGNDGTQEYATDESSDSTADDSGDSDTFDCTCPKCGHEFAVSIDDTDSDNPDNTDADASTSDQLPEMAGGGNDDTGDSADEMGFRMGGGRS